MTAELARSFRLDEPVGAIIIGLENGGPAEAAGARVGDVVLDWNGETIDDPTELPRLVAATPPGSLARMTVWRGGKRQTLPLRVGEVATEVREPAREAQTSQDEPRLRVGVRELDEAERKLLGVEYGLLVTGAASRAGLLPGDVILAVNQTRFASRAEFDRLMAALKKGDMVALFVRRGEASVYVPVEVG